MRDDRFTLPSDDGYEHEDAEGVMTEDKATEKRGLGVLRAGILGVTIVISMAAGALLATSVADDEPAPQQAAATAGAALPSSNQAVSNQGTDGERIQADAAAIAALPQTVERVRSSVVAVGTQSTGNLGFRAQGLGTGVVVDKDGHILTNYHVVEGASQVTVEFNDGTLVQGRVVGSDPGNDLAVVKVAIPAERLTPARFGNSDSVRLGESVFAIGNPFALKFTVTSGVVSGTERESEPGAGGRAIRGVLQTDAAVNPGNSGGPLFNLSGEVVGINTAIENPTGQRVFVGVGFAVPANTVQRFLPDMIAGRAITHPQLGVSGVALNEVNAREAGVTAQKGVYITSVSRGSAAERAGLRAAAPPVAGGGLTGGGDVVTAVDGKEVNTVQQLARIIDTRNVGDQVKLSVIRGGRQIELTATLQEWNASS